MSTAYNIVNRCLNVLGVAYGIEYIYTILGIIILALNIVSILYACIYSIYNKVKNKKYNEINDDINKAIDELNNLNKKGNDKDE